MTNSMNIHNVRKITISEITKLDKCFTVSINIEYNEYSKAYRNDYKISDFEIVLFSDKREPFEKINFWIPIKK